MRKIPFIFVLIFLSQNLIAADCNKVVEAIVDAESPANAEEVLSRSEFARFARSMRVVYTYLQCLMPSGEFRETSLERHGDLVKSTESAGFSSGGSFANPVLSKSTYTLCRDFESLGNKLQTQLWKNIRRFQESSELVQSICKMRLDLGNWSTSSHVVGNSNTRGHQPKNSPVDGKYSPDLVSGGTLSPLAKMGNKGYRLDQLINEYFVVTAEFRKIMTDKRTAVCGGKSINVGFGRNVEVSKLEVDENAMWFLKSRKIVRVPSISESESERLALDRRQMEHDFALDEISNQMIRLPFRMDYLGDCLNELLFSRNRISDVERNLSQMMSQWIIKMTLLKFDHQGCNQVVELKHLEDTREKLSTLEGALRLQSDWLTIHSMLKEPILSFRYLSSMVGSESFCREKSLDTFRGLRMALKEMNKQLRSVIHSHPDIRNEIQNFIASSEELQNDVEEFY